MFLLTFEISKFEACMHGVGSYFLKQGTSTKSVRSQCDCWRKWWTKDTHIADLVLHTCIFLYMQTMCTQICT